MADSGRVTKGTMSQLYETGHRRMQLDFWRDGSYAEPREVGPWADLYDRDGNKFRAVLIGMCDQDDRWIPMPPNESSEAS